MKKFLLSLFMILDVFADTTTVDQSGTLGDGSTGVKLDEAVRDVYSREIEYKAIPNMRFLQFAEVKTELGTEPGLTINMMTYDNLSMGGELTEGTDMETQSLSASQKSIQVGERGNAVAVSELALQSSFDDLMQRATDLLARDVALVLDTELRDTALGVSNVVYARSNSDGSKQSGRGDVLENDGLTVAVIKDAVEILATNNAPKFDGNYYISFVHPHQSRDLRDDPAWIEASKYANPDQLFTGEIGRIEDVRFIETTLMPNADAPEEDPAYDASLLVDPDSTPDSGDEYSIYKSIVFGESLYGYAVGIPVELRDNGVQDFGRKHGLAWYAIWGAGILHENRGVVVETA
jgi:N4-gp56 family major capsid protein